MLTATPTPLEEAYMDFVEFLMLTKQRLFICAASHGLTGMQAIALCLLNKPRPMNNFGKVFNCDPSNVTGIVDGLVQKGLVERFENPKDRRIKMVKLQRKGSTVRTTLLHDLFGASSIISSKLSPVEVYHFTKLIGKITQGELTFI